MDGQEGFDFVFKLSCICLRSIGAWPELYQSFIARALTEFHQFLCLFIIFTFANIMQTIQLILFWGNLNVMINVLSTADLPIANVTFMMIKFWRKRQVLRDLIAMVRTDWMSRGKSDRELLCMNASASSAKALATICVTLGQCACVFYLVLHVYLQWTLAGPDTNGRLLYLDAYLPYDGQRTPNYELTWLCQCLSTFISTAGFIGFESFFVVVVMHVCGQLNCLRHRLRNLCAEAKKEKGEDKDDRFRQEIATIVERHNYLHRIASKIEDIFNSVNFVQLINFNIIFCLLGFRVVTMLTDGDGTLIEAVFLVGFFTYLSSNLFICCYVAEQLRTESMAVAFATYNSCWYNMQTEEAKSLILILLRAKRPFEITAGKFFIFSLDTFSSLMKTSASYMSVLIAMKNKGCEQ